MHPSEQTAVTQCPPLDRPTGVMQLKPLVYRPSLHTESSASDLTYGMPCCDSFVAQLKIVGGPVRAPSQVQLQATGDGSGTATSEVQREAWETPQLGAACAVTLERAGDFPVMAWRNVRKRR